jgi:hypothetical protein
MKNKFHNTGNLFGFNLKLKKKKNTKEMEENRLMVGIFHLILFLGTIYLKRRKKKSKALK